MIFMTALLIIGGLALLIAGGDIMVRGAVGVATRLGVSPLVIGLTLVGFGTSTPELVTSVQASMAGSPGIAVGNIVGSNIANILLIMGVAALVAPIAVSSASLKRDGGIMIAVAILFAALSAVADLSRLTGVVFVSLLVAYVVFSFRQERAAPADHGAAYDKGVAVLEVDGGFSPSRASSLGWSLTLAMGGLVLVVIGGKFLVDGAVALARGYGISETVIGLTIVAVGTSMPELVTSVVAAFRRQAEVAFGNVVGSNIYNILGIGGVTALIAPTTVPPEMVRFDNLIMVGVSLVLFAFAWTGLRIGRREGGLLICGYLIYLVVLWPK